MLTKSLPLLLGILILASACRKDRSKPDDPGLPYSWRNLHDVEVNYYQGFNLNIDQGDQPDVYFGVELVNTAEGTRNVFVASSIYSSRLLSVEDSICKLSMNETIPVTPKAPVEWDGFAMQMCEELFPKNNPGDSTWRGRWKGAERQYVAVRFEKSNELYLGWVSVSVDTAHDRMILHDCAWRPLSAGTAQAGKK